MTSTTAAAGAGREAASALPRVPTPIPSDLRSRTVPHGTFVPISAASEPPPPTTADVREAPEAFFSLGTAYAVGYAVQHRFEFGGSLPSFSTVRYRAADLTCLCHKHISYLSIPTNLKNAQNEGKLGLILQEIIMTVSLCRQNLELMLKELKAHGDPAPDTEEFRQMALLEQQIREDERLEGILHTYMQKVLFKRILV